MELRGYAIVADGKGGTAVFRPERGLLKCVGRDHLSFLQGQLTNDVYSAVAGEVQRTSLLNNTGHLLAEVFLIRLPDSILLATDQRRLSILRKSLERFVVRERVEFEDVTDAFAAISLLGAGATVTSCNLEKLVDGALISTSHPQLSSPVAVDLFLPAEKSVELTNALLALPGVVCLDEETVEILRVESGTPAWGRELVETIIPLEAGFDDAISYTKGCYMGQEVIARIHSRGHTNRTMVGVRLTSAEISGTAVAVTALSGDRAGQEIGRITSAAHSPRFGPIGLGYVRNEFSVPGTLLSIDTRSAEVAALPFSQL